MEIESFSENEMNKEICRRRNSRQAKSVKHNATERLGGGYEVTKID